MIGWMLVDKPAGMTSHDVVGRVRRAARSRRVGHAGTLDPFATGLVVVAVGPATRLLPYLDAEPKVYDAVIRFGTETDTDDVTGTAVRSALLPAREALPGAIQALTGTIAQIPPAFSAKHVAGERAYAIARRGQAVELPAVPVTVHRWDVLDEHERELRVRITCAGGTYIRALARDLGRALGSAAHCVSLRRVASGAARVEDAVALEVLDPGAIAEGRVAMRQTQSLLAHLPAIVLNATTASAIRVGQSIPGEAPAGALGVLIEQGEVIGIAASVADATGTVRWQPRVVLPPAVPGGDR